MRDIFLSTMLALILGMLAQASVNIVDQLIVIRNELTLTNRLLEEITNR